MKKALIICGPTASGKTSLALNLADKYQGEIISADSRQIYKGLDIGTGKDVGKDSKFKKTSSLNNFDIGFHLIDQIPIWLLDIAKPSQEFSLVDWLSCVEIAFKEILKKKKLPIFVGGTGLYLKYLTEKFDNQGIGVNQELRDRLGKLSVEQLKKELKDLDKKVFALMNHSDRNNPRRLIRKIEILTSKKGAESNLIFNLVDLDFEVLTIGLMADKKEIDQRVDLRIQSRLKQGLIAEIKALLKQGHSWSDPGFNTLAYKEFELFFLGKKGLEESIADWRTHEHQYVKRQLTWFKKQLGINWFDFTDLNLVDNVVNRITKWYSLNS